MKKKNTLQDLQEYEKQFVAQKDETKEVKEGGEFFTGGEWEVKSGELKTLHIHAGHPHVATINTWGNLFENAKANAALIAQSKNMYYLLKSTFEEYQKTGSISANCLAEWLSIQSKANSNY